jgi:hypothetical protein
MKNGPYTLVIAPIEYPGIKYRGRYCYEHHLVWWQHTGEILTDGFLIHHIDENKKHNIFSNLEKKTKSNHTRDHRPPPEVWEIVCYECKKVFPMLASAHRDRSKQYGNSNLCCSRSCQVRKQQRERKINSL